MNRKKAEKEAKPPLEAELPFEMLGEGEESRQFARDPSPPKRNKK